MKKNLFLVVFLASCSFLHAQSSSTIVTFLFRDENAIPVPDLSFYVTQDTSNPGNNLRTTNNKGSLEMQMTPGRYYLMLAGKFFSFAYEQRAFPVDISGAKTEVIVEVNRSSILADETVITAYRAKKDEPISQANLSREFIERKNDGRDLPAILNNTPGVISYSDGGLGFGYSQLRLRGIDQFRINMTVNGVPINDAETNGFYTNNFSDILSSASQVQVQRGVGLSAYGSPSTGGSVNVITKSPEKSASAQFINSYGSFNTHRHVGEFNTGMLENKAAVYGRISHIYSDGYRDHATVNNMSYLFSVVLPAGKNVLRFNAWGGNSTSGLAYSPVSQSVLDTNRTYNPLSVQERDRFHQNFFQFQFERKINASTELAASLYYVKGAAPYFDAIFPNYFSWNNMPDAVVGTDTIYDATFTHRYRLDQDLYGAYVNFIKRSDKATFTAGANAFQFVSDHFVEIMWASVWPQNTQPGHLAYYNTGTKTEASAFARIDYALTRRLTFMADVQYRFAQWQYSYRQMEIWQDNPVPVMQWNFVNPKAGLKYDLNASQNIYLFAGSISREPTRLDYFKDDKANGKVTQDDIKPEQLFNAEAGYRFTKNGNEVLFNLFYMNYTNQIVATGAVNAYGASINSNIGKSSRYGAEIQFNVRINNKLRLYNASSFCEARIQEITLPVTVYNSTDTTFENIKFSNTPAALSPRLIINQSVIYEPLRWLSAEATFRYVSDQYIDNTGSDLVKVKAWYTIDAGIGIQLNRLFKGITTGEHFLGLQVNNITNQLYNLYGALNAYENTATRSAGGMVTVNTPVAYFPAATTSFLATYRVRF